MNKREVRIVRILQKMKENPFVSIAELAEYNIRTVREIAERILQICEQPMNFERILQALFADYGLTMNFEQYALVGNTVKSYLVWLKDSGRMDAEFTDNLLLWHTVK